MNFFEQQQDVFFFQLISVLETDFTEMFSLCSKLSEMKSSIRSRSISDLHLLLMVLKDIFSWFSRCRFKTDRNDLMKWRFWPWWNFIEEEQKILCCLLLNLQNLWQTLRLNDDLLIIMNNKESPSSARGHGAASDEQSASNWLN